MAFGPGKYDQECTWLRQQLEAAGVLILVFNGRSGSGFSAQLPLDLTLKIPQLLRTIADEIEKGGGAA